jgi:hypothetical protein
MSAHSIPLGPADRLVRLYSYPNKPGSTEVLADTILHWFNQTLVRDGLASQGANASVRCEGSAYFLDLNGPPALEGDFATYAQRLPQFLENGWQALGVVDKLKKPSAKPKEPWPDWLDPPAENKLWDPRNSGRWRYFLPLGMAMVHQKSLQFFHYPPIRLLDQMRDYQDDPVPVRLVELLKANGAPSDEEAWLNSVVMDGAPIAAPDDQGTIYFPGPYDPTKPPVHLIPIDHFEEYQRAQTELLLNVSSVNEKYTVPIIVYGTPARETFGRLYMKGKKVSDSRAATVEVIKGKKTAVFGSGHPYAFFAQAQAEVGSGSILPENWPTAVETMYTDLVVSRWQVEMSKDPTQDPNSVLEKCRAYWQADKQQATLHQLVLHQGSLFYPDPTSLEFTFKLSMEDVAERAQAVAQREAKKKRAAKSASKRRRS